MSFFSTNITQKEQKEQILYFDYRVKILHVPERLPTQQLSATSIKKEPIHGSFSTQA